MSDLRFPIGRFQIPVEFTDDLRKQHIQAIAKLPQQLADAIEGLSDQQLDTPYREGGWTVRQVVHHLADSHLNSYTRFRLALTEETPTIRPYDEKKWAELDDAKHASVSASLAILDGLHARWSSLLHSFSAGDWQKSFDHPETGMMSLDVATALYAWHGQHHTAHITTLRKQQNW